jgi:acyl-[acyl-carrier-protein]-phospholipid O-acyltransferase/long-chain-fatty-acid--[acyl-carrier-protein] ligase
MDKLFKLTGFVPFILIIFLNAFVDLGHKILIQNTVFKIYDGQTQIILTAIVNGLILLPFVLLFSPAGFLSDRHQKPLIMKASAGVAVALTLLITLSYYLGWFQFSFAMTFLLAAQSAFYSPAKYGYIKELTGKDELATANAVVQAVTIVAILFGVFAFSVLFEWGLAGVSYENDSQLLQAIAPLGWILVICSSLELMFAMRLPAREAAAPGQRFDVKAYSKGRYLRDNLNKILANRTIWLSIVGLSAFWGISRVALAAFPAFAKETLGLFRVRHHCRCPAGRSVFEAPHRDGPRPAGCSGYRYRAFLLAATRLAYPAGYGFPVAGRLWRHVHRTTQCIDSVPCPGRPTGHRAGRK